MKIADNWQDYQIIDMANGEKVERWGEYILRRPDPQIVWNSPTFNNHKYDAIYHRSDKGGGYWEKKIKLKDRWQVKYNDLTFNVKLMSFVFAVSLISASFTTLPIPFHTFIIICPPS